MPEELAHQTGPQGEQSLIEQTGPSGEKYLVNKEGCENCCGNCLQYLRADPCGPVDVPYDDCEGGSGDPVPPPPVYLNTLIQCFGRGIQPGDTVVVDGRCYTVTIYRFKRATDTCALPPIPPDARILDSVDDCARNCQDPKCIIFSSPWGTAEQCDPSIEPGPPVFFCRRIATRCAYIGFSPGPGLPVRCYRIAPDSPGGVPGPRSPIIGSIDGGVSTCCECTSNLGPSDVPCFQCSTLRIVQTAGTPVATQVRTDGPNCCFDRRATCSMTVKSRYFVGDVLGNSELYEIDPQTIPCTGGIVQARVTRTENGQSLPPVFEPVSVPVGGVSQSRLCPPEPPRFGIEFNNIWSFDLRIDCKGSRLTASAPQSGGLPTTLSSSITYNHADGSRPCAGGCAGSGPPLPVPQALWPEWAKAIAFVRNPDDKGVGDTFERELGRVGSIVKWALEKAAGGCKCAQRKRDWNAMYGY